MGRCITYRFLFILLDTDEVKWYYIYLNALFRERKVACVNLSYQSVWHFFTISEAVGLSYFKTETPICYNCRTALTASY